MRLDQHYYLPYRFKVLWGYKTQYKKHLKALELKCGLFENWHAASKRINSIHLFQTTICLKQVVILRLNTQHFLQLTQAITMSVSLKKNVEKKL
jgi:hypothetical protein